MAKSEILKKIKNIFNYQADTKQESFSKGEINKLTKEEIDLLAHTVFGEARGEPMEGRIAVAAVILNRTKDANFPSNIREVIFQQDAFTCVSDGQFNLEPDQEAYDAVYKALMGVDPTEGAVYYWNPKTATSDWVRTRTIVKQIGRHVFAK